MSSTAKRANPKHLRPRYPWDLSSTTFCGSQKAESERPPIRPVVEPFLQSKPTLTRNQMGGLPQSAVVALKCRSRAEGELLQRLLSVPRPLVERLGQDFFRQLTERPGVYTMRHAWENILYVGKAKNIKKRLNDHWVANPVWLGRCH